jgi:hypothetical protein
VGDGAGELRPLPSHLLWGFAFTCLGGPLALLAVELPACGLVLFGLEVVISQQPYF